MKIKILVFFAVMLASLGQAFAADPCADIVADEAGVLNASQFQSVTSAAQKLEAKGVDVRVYIAKDLHSHKNLKSLKEQLLDQCKAWQVQGSNGKIGMKPNFFVLMVTMKPKRFSMFYGQGLESKVAPLEKELTNNIAKSKLATGDIAGGLIQGLNDVSSLVQLTAAQRAAPVTIQHQEATDYSGLWSVLAWVLGLLACIAVAVIGARAYGARSRQRTNQLEAKTHRTQCANLLNNFASPHAILLSGVKSSTKIQDWQKRILFAKLEIAKARFDSASMQFSSLGSAGNDPSIPGLSDIEYKGMAQRYSKVSDDLSSSVRSLRQIEGLLQRPDNISPDPDITPDHPVFQEKKGNELRQPPAPASVHDLGTRRGRREGRSRPDGERTRDREPEPRRETHVPETPERDSGAGDVLLGVLIGQVMSNRNQSDHHHQRDDEADDHRPAARHTEPEPQVQVDRGSGGDEETGFESVSRGSGGEEASFGEVDRGGGGNEASFEPEPEMVAEPEPAPEPDPEPEPEASFDSDNDQRN